MIQRLQKPAGSGSRTARRRTPRPPIPPLVDGETMPALPPPETAVGDDATILGFPAEDVDEADGPAEDADTGDEDGLLVLRDPDRVAAAFLICAGVAANVSLFLPWTPDDSTYGLALVQQAMGALGDGIGELVDGSLWPPPVLVLAGGLFVVLGILLLVPARSHRLLGVLALGIALAAGAAAVVLLSDLGWQVDQTSIGLWCAVAVPVLGLLGALKAMLTLPHVTIGRRV